MYTTLLDSKTDSDSITPFSMGPYLLVSIFLLIDNRPWRYMMRANFEAHYLCAYMHAHSRPMIDGLNLRASSSDTSLRSTTEALIIGG